MLAVLWVDSRLGGDFYSRRVPFKIMPANNIVHRVKDKKILKYSYW